MDKFRSIIWHGERGIVNGLAIDVSKRKPDSLRSFLRMIEWVGGQVLTWIDDVEDAHFLIEPSLGSVGFGIPDLIMICRLNDGSRRYVFLEAKVVPYQFSARPNSQGMRDRGYNSSINGQLSLDFRFALAVQDFGGGPRLTEEDEVFRFYAESLHESSRLPRRLHKTQTIREIVVPLLQGLRIGEAYFVAMTADDASPFTTVQQDFVPLLYLGRGTNQQDYASQHLGFVPLCGLPEELFPPDGYFRQSCRLFLSQERPVAVPEQAGWRPLMSRKRLEEWPTDEQGFAQRVAEIVNSRCGDLYLWDRSIKGSYSFRVPMEAGKTVAKLALSDDRPPRLLAGFSAVIPGAEDFARQVSPEVMQRRFQGEPFYMSPVDIEGDPEAVADVFIEFLAEAHESLG